MPRQEVSKLLERPRFAFPTTAIFFLNLAAWLASTYAGMYLNAPLTLCIAINAMASFGMFTVTHEAVHKAVSTIRWINNLFGRSSAVFLGPLGEFGAFRFVHLEHHKYTNVEGKDPDLWSGKGPSLLLPLRWATQPYCYLYAYLSKITKRPIMEVLELLATLGLVWGISAYVIKSGYGVEWLVYYFLPSQLAIVVLGGTFDYLPHHYHTTTIDQDKFKTTALVTSAIWPTLTQPLLNAVLYYQTYHVIHHLYPTVPFYQYSSMYRLKKQELEEHHVPERKLFYYLHTTTYKQVEKEEKTE
jgi:beta-carotene hydroxylase